MNIHQIEKEINYLKLRISKLETEIEKEKQKNIKPIKSKTFINASEPVFEIKYEQNLEEQRNIKRELDIEKPRKVSEVFVGKYALPVIASMMILIGICAMGFIVWDIIPDMLKATLVFMIAGCCFGIGYWFGRNDRMPAFKNAMFSTGLAVLYTDLILMQSVWFLVSEYLAIGLFLVWCIFGILMSKHYEEKLFYWITVTGIAVTTLLLKESVSYDLRGFIISSIMIAAFGINCFLFLRQYEEGNPVFGLTAIVLLYSLGYHGSNLDEKNGFCLAIQILVILAMLCFTYFKDQIIYTENKKQDIFSEILLGIYALFGPFLLLKLEVAGQTLSMFLIMIFTGLFLKGKKNRELLSFFLMPALLYAFAYISLDNMDNFAGWSILAGILFIVSKRTREHAFMVQFMIVNVLCIITSFFTLLLSSMITIESLILMGIGAIAIYSGIFLYSFIKENSYYDSMMSFGCILIHIYLIGYTIANKEDETWIIFIMAIMLFCVFTGVALLLIRRFSEKIRPSLSIFAVVISFVFLMMYLTTDGTIISSLLAIIIIIHMGFAIYLFGVLKEEILWKDITSSAFLLGNLLMLSSKTIVWDYGIILSLCVIILSSLFIIVGFTMKKKGTRLFGLITIMVSIAKMLLIDISETNSFIRVVAFIIGGIVCFGISYAYNRLEKTLVTSEELP